MPVIRIADSVEFLLPNARALGVVNGPHPRERQLWIRPQDFSYLVGQRFDLRRRKPGLVRLVDGIDGYYVWKKSDGTYALKEQMPGNFTCLWIYRENELVYASVSCGDHYCHLIRTTPSRHKQQVDVIE